MAPVPPDFKSTRVEDIINKHVDELNKQATPAEKKRNETLRKAALELVAGKTEASAEAKDSAQRYHATLRQSMVMRSELIVDYDMSKPDTRLNDIVAVNRIRMAIQELPENVKKSIEGQIKKTADSVGKMKRDKGLLEESLGNVSDGSPIKDDAAKLLQQAIENDAARLAREDVIKKAKDLEEENKKKAPEQGELSEAMKLKAALAMADKGGSSIPKLKPPASTAREV